MLKDFYESTLAAIELVAILAILFLVCSLSFKLITLAVGVSAISLKHCAVGGILVIVFLTLFVNATKESRPPYRQ